MVFKEHRKNYMKSSTTFWIMMTIVLIAKVVYLLNRRRRRNHVIATMEQQLKAQDFTKTMRKISLENQTDNDLVVKLTLMQQNNDLHVQEHVMPARKTGWVPFFVPGTMRVTVGKESVEMDISQENKEYHVTMTSEGKLQEGDNSQ